MCTPALRALHTRFPQARLTVAARKGVSDLLRDLPGVADCVVLPARPGIGAIMRLGRLLRPAARDLCVVFPHSFRSALLARCTGARQRVGYARDGRTWLLTNAPEPHRENGDTVPIYMAYEYLQLLECLGCKDDDQGLELAADTESAEAVGQKLNGAHPVVGIAPGAAFGPSKQWPAERFAAVADALVAQAGAACVLITGPGEEALRHQVKSTTRAPFVKGLGDAGGIERLKATISQLDVLIGNDSGPRHVAIAFGKPVICIMGPTSPRYSESPWERGKVIRIDVDCGPCQKPTCTTDHRCMTGIPPESVVRAALPWITTPATP